MIIQPTVAQITQVTVIWILIAATVLVIGLLVLIGIIAVKAELKYGNFFVVVVGLMAALIGFLVAFPLLVSGVFTEPTQVVALLSGLFGIIGTLVGTYFGVKSSGDAREGAQQQLAVVTTGPTTTAPQLTVAAVTPPENAANVPVNTNVTATFSRAVNPASITQQTFQLVSLPNRASVPGNHSFEAQNTRVAFTPNNPLAAGIAYQVTITTDITDQSGQKLVSEKTWTFTTSTSGATPPTSGATPPTSGATPPTSRTAPPTSRTTPPTSETAPGNRGNT